ncbi:MAG: ABC-type transport auxiliary lipoprotein family protein [Parasulfuritortus sp.]|nr:ABC-type transport auxiliary lipoprotein family protein [Parasulfuritortus sp.]
MKRMLPFIVALMLAGCTSLSGSSQPVTHYVLTDPGPAIHLPNSHPGVLLLREMDAPAFYQEPGLAYSREPGTRSHYEFAQWAELPGKRLTWLLRQRLETAGVFAVVAPMGSGVVGDYQLNTRLIDFYHDASVQPGSAFLLIEAELVRRSRGELMARQTFLAQVPVASYDAAGAASAMDSAATKVIDEITVWLAKVTG